MRSPTEIVEKIKDYQIKLEELIHLKNNDSPSNMDILALSLIDKIEALLWVLEIEPEDEVEIEASPTANKSLH
jgi:hypothetical protein